MKLIGKHNKTLEKEQTKEEAKDTIMKAGVLIEDEQLDKVAGGTGDSEGNCRETYIDDSGAAVAL